MKTALYIFLALAALIVIGLIVRAQTPPKFTIDSIDRVSKTGEFVFSGIKNSFGPDGFGKSVAGRNGYVLTTGSNDGKSMFFKLYKNGVYIKDYPPINF